MDIKDFDMDDYTIDSSDFEYYEGAESDLSYWDLFDSINKVQYQSKSILSDDGSPMEFKDSDGKIISSFLNIEENLDINTLLDWDMCVMEYIDEDEEMSVKENECDDFHPINSENFL